MVPSLLISILFKMRPTFFLCFHFLMLFVILSQSLALFSPPCRVLVIVDPLVEVAPNPLFVVFCDKLNPFWFPGVPAAVDQAQRGHLRELRMKAGFFPPFKLSIHTLFSGRGNNSQSCKSSP